MLTQSQQLIETIQRAKRILLLGPENSDVATLSSLIALHSFLILQNKNVDIAIPEYDAQTHPAFLKSDIQIFSNIPPLRNSIIKISLHDIGFKNLTHSIQDEVLSIHITPISGELAENKISFSKSEDVYDSIITIDVPDMMSLGSAFQKNADALYRLPIINIDTHNNNEHWGQINIVDFTAVASGEILFRMMTEWNRSSINENIATALLTSMIARTRSFRTLHVTPRTLQTASELVSLGARRQDIVHGLWRNKSISMLRLWGCALMRLEQDRDRGIVWSILTRTDFISAGSSREKMNVHALNGIVEELLSYAPEAKIVALIHEHPENIASGVCVSIHTKAPYNASDLIKKIGTSTSREYVQFCLLPGVDLIEGAMSVIKTLQDAIDIQA